MLLQFRQVCINVLLVDNLASLLVLSPLTWKSLAGVSEKLFYGGKLHEKKKKIQLISVLQKMFSGQLCRDGSVPYHWENFLLPLFIILSLYGMQ